MKILVTGASGFVASQIVNHLMAAGHQLTCAVRDTRLAARIFPRARVIACDFIKDTDASIWLERLKDIEVVINCVGILYHPDDKITWAIHYETPRALFDACVKSGVKKIIQISALGIEQSDCVYAQSKKAADDYLLNLSIKAIILRPSLIYGRGSYGGSSLFRGLAGLPGFIFLPGTGKQEMQPIHLEDLSRAVQVLLTQPVEKNCILTAVGPERLKLRDILTQLRQWLGFAKAKLIAVPLIFIRCSSWLGDFIPYSSINKTAYQMLMQNNIATEAESKKFIDAIQFTPRPFSQAIFSAASSVQDHWHARLYFLRPALRLGIAFIWLFSAIVSAFFYPKAASYALLAKIGINHFWQPILLYGASLLDGLIGLAVLLNYKMRLMTILQIALILIYTFILSWKLPAIWLEPFAPLAKNIPLLLAILVYAALHSEK